MSTDNIISDDWELDFKWLEVRHLLMDLMQLQSLPDLQSILFLVGIQELGQVKEEYTKEEKQDLIHIATCRLLSYDGHYEFEGIDADGWPHWKLISAIPFIDLKSQENYLKTKLIQYVHENIKA